MASVQDPSFQQEFLVSRRGPEKDQPAATVDAGDDLQSVSSDGAQAGVRKVEAVTSTWSKWGLIFAYVGCENSFRYFCLDVSISQLHHHLIDLLESS